MHVEMRDCSSGYADGRQDRRSVMWAESMALNDQLQVAAVQKEKYGTKDGTLVYTTYHGAGR